VEEAIVRLSLLVNGVCDWEEMHLASLSRDLKRVVDDSRAIRSDYSGGARDLDLLRLGFLFVWSLQ
jgi:hypothetical protein